MVPYAMLILRVLHDYYIGLKLSRLFWVTKNVLGWVTNFYSAGLNSNAFTHWVFLNITKVEMSST